MIDFLKSRKDLLAAVLTSLFLCLFIFHDYVFCGRPYITDTDAGLIFAYRAAAVNAIRATGSIPLWNPLTMTGSPWIGQDVQANIIHIFHLIMLPFANPVTGYMAGLMLCYFFALLFVFFVFLRIFRFGLLVTVLSTALYGFNAAIHPDLMNLFTIGTFLGFPALILCAWNFVRTGRRVHIVWAVAAATACYYVSPIINLQVLFAAFPVLLWFFLRRDGRAGDGKKAVWACFGFMLLTLLLCAPVLWPTIHHALECIRPRGAVPTADFRYLIYWFCGQLFSTVNFLTMQYTADVPSVQTYFNKLFPSCFVYSVENYVSILSLFCLLGYRCIKSRTTFYFFVGCLLIPFLTGILQGLPGISWVVFKTTGGHGFVQMMHNVIVFGSAGLAGLLIQEAKENSLQFQQTEKKIFNGVVAIVGAVILCVIGVFTVIFVVFASSQDFILRLLEDPQVREAVRAAIFEKFHIQIQYFDVGAVKIMLHNLSQLFSVASLIYLLLFACAKLLLLGVSLRYFCHAQKTKAVFSLLIALGIMDGGLNLIYMGRGSDLISRQVFDRTSIEHKFLEGLNLSNRTAVYFPGPDQYERRYQLGEKKYPFPHPYRFYPLMLNYQMPYLVPSYSSYLSLWQRGQDVFHDGISTDKDRDIEYYFKGKKPWRDSEAYLYNLYSELVDYAGIDYIFSPIMLDIPKLVLYRKGDYYWIYRNQRSQGRFDFVPDEAVKMAGDGITYDYGHSLASTRNPYQVLEADFQFDTVSVKLDAKEEGYFVLKDTYADGWHVYVDGELTPMLAANGVFRAVMLAPGQHVVQFQYFPKGLTAGLWSCFFGFAGIVGLLASERGRRKSKGQATA